MSATDLTLLQEAQQRVESMRTERDAALRKVAELEESLGEASKERDVYRATLSLVEEGIVDPSDATVKAAEFVESPSKLGVIAEAIKLGADGQTIGKLVAASGEETELGDSEHPELDAALRKVAESNPQILG